VRHIHALSSTWPYLQKAPTQKQLELIAALLLLLLLLLLLCLIHIHSVRCCWGWGWGCRLFVCPRSLGHIAVAASGQLGQLLHQPLCCCEG
jgi:hypothetical protein